ncbi:hypothetical protein BT93_C2403 [Corymbia citriodora subsp. variegata]|uniref:Uncharacterized protein n=1 Tax=Corymbia citriodora subsp. variegata TaxID=360336 RepID=A0A8T0CGT5_CORYI|nr:hypothetical protein BT93_L3670 [Corymbia citriodora subsp. variegata]KAF8036665.1 hypothetical protein BT93_C2403 [Corymbia citriodora subsp. variegata]
MGTSSSSSSKWWILRRNLKNAVKKIQDMLIRRWRRITNSVVSGAPRRHWPRSHTSLSRQHGIEEADWNESISKADGALERAKMASFHNDGIWNNNPYEYDCEEDDIDGRAENFIANFRRRLQMERQVSLELRYS